MAAFNVLINNFTHLEIHNPRLQRPGSSVLASRSPLPPAIVALAPTQALTLVLTLT